MAPDARLHQLASRQHGLVTTNQTRRLGLSEKQIRSRLNRGLLIRISRYVLRVAGSPATPEQQILAAVWSCGPTAVASHTTAAWLHGFDGFSHFRVVPEILVKRPATGNRALAKVHQTLKLSDRDRMTIGGIPVTRPERTLAELGASVSLSKVEQATDGALRDGVVSIESLRRSLFAIWRPGPTGLSSLARTLNTDGARPESWLERKALRVFADVGLPRPTVQVVHDVAGHTFRLDFTFPTGLIVEVSGHRTHSTRRQRQADAERRNRLLLAGLPVWEFTYEDVIERPAWVTETIWAALAASKATAG